MICFELSRALAIEKGEKISMQQYYFDTLPIHPPPERLESLTSYLIRLAEANDHSDRDSFALFFRPLGIKTMVVPKVKTVFGRK